MAVIDTPLQQPPAGVISNYDNPTFLGMPIIIVAGISIPLILILSCLRLYARAIVLRKWRLEDCVWAVTTILGLVFVAFSLPFILQKPTGFHAWDINIETISKASLLRLHAYLLAYGPMLWLIKLSLFCFLFKYFRSTRWLRNTVYIGIILTGLVFSGYTIVVATACGPRPESDAKSYLNGLQSGKCISPTGIHAIASGIANIVNFITNLILIALPVPLIKTLNLTSMERRGIYGILCVGGFASLSSMVTIIYRFKLWKSDDFTGSLIPLNVSILVEVTLSIIIPCLPSFGTLYDHITYIDINDKTIIGAPKSPKSLASSGKPPISPPLTPPSATQPSWRRVNLNIEDLPYREKNEEFVKSHTTVNSISTIASSESRMKALPCTPLPFSMPGSPTAAPPLPTPSTPELPKSPASVRSMQLPIVYSPTRNEWDNIIRTPILH